MKTEFEYGNAAKDLGVGNRECAHCGRALRGRFVWLEMDTRTGQFTTAPVDPEHSQGVFPVGVTCAKTIARETSTV